MEPEQIVTDMLLVVAAALIDAQGRVLVQRRPPGSSLAGLWEFPGGKPEAGESPERALARELDEELGISVEAADLTAVTFASEPLGHRHLLLLLFTCRVWERDPQPLHATELRWVHPAKLREMEMPPADYPLIAALEKML
ncbi:MAG: (deoxy)nucleoside triphosphate pyrophosphohydrolase [Sphingomonadales bacterium]|nr:(deoxy)nucleoside triphosphate pyrophosphohydrolase [Sphingomonadales bacterium]